MKLSVVARELASIIRRHDLNYTAFNKACKEARKKENLRPPKQGRKLPKLLPDDILQRYFAAVEKAANTQHEIMLKLLFYTGVRVAELCNIKTSDVDLAAGKIFIESGKGDRDRYIVFPDSFKLVLRTYIQTHADNEYLFESKQRRHYSERRIQQIVEHYQEAAGIEQNVHPHLFRHQILTWLKRQGLEDAQIQLISGHASRKSLEIYTHLGLKDVTDDYQAALRKAEI